ncbi:DUF1707 SHOCT-like domain-containing protein [Symbioplanes lichenis]|uniref:DUF1707 SHOCT-like domain-containing protein n=1 Tax=Symbioplanes lichenis TaxID=1629072 RepID=UPI0027389F73|nr:DUF1707 domain-containing protein [Actinoplanes lichenis]
MSDGWRISHQDRSDAAERLRAALEEGRITLDEYDDRHARVQEARTYGDLAGLLADLPGPPVTTDAPEFLPLTTTAATLRRKGRWLVPHHLQVNAKAGAVRLDFSEAVIPWREVRVELAVYMGSTVLVLPPGASADVDAVELVAGSGRVRVPVIRGEGPHFVVSGRQVAGNLVVRHPYHFLRRR